jgi:hypothetical protein
LKSCGGIRADNAAADRKAKRKARILELAAAQANLPGDVLININLSRAEYAALLELEATGLFGIRLGDVVVGLIRDRIRALILDGWVTPPTGFGKPRRQSKP